MLFYSSVVFNTASTHPTSHYLKETELNIQVDESFKSSVPLHPLYVLVREIVVYFISKGCVDVVRDAIDAGINMKFELLYAPTNIKFNLLHLACRFASETTPEIVGLLIQRGGIDPNSVNDSGYTALHTVAIQGSLDMAQSLLLCGADPNLPSRRPDYMAPIHLAAKSRNYFFLKPFIYVNSVDINQLDAAQNHLIQYALFNRSIGFFRDLLLHPNILLQFTTVPIVLDMIHYGIPIQDERYYDAFVDHLMTRKSVHESHLHHIVFLMIVKERIAVLCAFQRKSFDFSFVHKSAFNRADRSVLSVAMNYDCLESFKFLVDNEVVVPEEDLVVSAVSEGSTRIIAHLLQSLTLSPDNLRKCLEIISKQDRLDLLRIFVDKFGEVILEEIHFDLESNPCISLFYLI